MLDVGETITEVPLPTKVPPQLPLYQFQLAPVPSEPPTTVSVVLAPLHIVLVPEMPVGVTEGWFTVIVVEAHVVIVLHGAGSSALT